MFRQLWRMAGGSALAAGGVSLGAGQLADLSKFIQMLILPNFEDPELAARAIGVLLSLFVGVGVGVAKTLASKEV